MVRPRGLVALALSTELELGTGSRVPRAPVRWEEPGTNTEGTEEMVNCQAGETCSKTEVRGEVRGEERLTTKYQCVDQTPDTL